MSVTDLKFQSRDAGASVGLKGPRAAQWLQEQGITVPPTPNTWVDCAHSGPGDGPLVARLGASEFFLEAGRGNESLRALVASLALPLAGVYPVLREDAAFLLSGDGTLDLLAQVCNVDFGACVVKEQKVIMTLMIGVAVLIVPHPKDGSVRYRIWCDPTFGSYLGETISKIVMDCGGSYGGASA